MPEEPTADIVFAVAASPAFAEDGICFGARQSGLYRSADAGQSWQFAYGSLRPTDAILTQMVALSPDFACDHTVLAGVNGAILRSTDAGLTWQACLLPTPPPAITGLAFSPNYAGDGSAFCSTMEDGVFCSTDRGARWAACNFGLLDFRLTGLVISPAYARDELIFVGAESGVYLSRNGGRAWRASSFPMEAGPVISLGLSPAYADDATLCAGTEDGQLFVSNDGSQHWRVAARFDEAVNQIVLGPDWPRRSELLLLVGTSLQYSPDGGRNWKERQFHPSTLIEPTCLAAPSGVSPSSLLLMGTVGAGVVWA